MCPFVDPNYRSICQCLNGHTFWWTSGRITLCLLITSYLQTKGGPGSKYRAAKHLPPSDISHPRFLPPSSFIPSVIQVTHLAEWWRVSHGYLAMPRSSFSFTMLNLGSVSWSSFCFSSIFSRSFCRSFNRRFWRKKRRDGGRREREGREYD